MSEIFITDPKSANKGSMHMRDQATALRNLKERAENISTREPFAAKGGPISLVVTSGKGGVGKSQFSISLAIALSRFGKKTILFDADMGLANVDIILGIHPEWHLVHVLDGSRRVKEIIVPGPEGIRIIPASSGVERLANLDTGLMEQLFREMHAAAEDAHFLIVDTGAGISRTVMQFAASGDRVLVVVTPEPASFADAYAAIKCIYRHRPDARIGFVANNCRKMGEGKDIYNRMRLMVLQFLQKNIEYMGELPHERGFVNAVRKQRSIMMEAPGCPYARAVAVLARKIAGTEGTRPVDKPGFFARFLAFLWKLEGESVPV